MKRILYVATVDMYARSGGGLATRAYYAALCKLYPNKVDLMHAKEYYVPSEKDVDAGDTILTVRKSKVKRFAYFFIGHIHRFYPEIIDYLKCNVDKYSLCVINGGVYAGDSILQIKDLGIKVAVIHHNYECDYHRDNKTMSTFWGHFMYWVFRNERISYLNSDLNFFLTIDDMNKFKDIYGNSHAPCIRLGCFDYKITPLLEPILPVFNNTLVISGSLKYYQSEHGILEFCNNIFLKYIKSNPDFRLILTGSNPTEKIKKMVKKYSANMFLYENPLDISTCVKMGSVFLCPVSIGSGLKLRIMDGLKLGMPIITHINSIRGYEEFREKLYFKTYFDYASFEEAINIIRNGFACNKIVSEDIQNDYNLSFSFHAGVARLMTGLEKVNYRND